MAADAPQQECRFREKREVGTCPCLDGEHADRFGGIVPGTGGDLAVPGIAGGLVTDMRHQDELLARVAAEAKSDGWWEPGQKLVVAVSGGPDSMALLHILWQMAQPHPDRLIAAHVNHRFRGAESDAEAELVKQTAIAWGIPHESTSIDVPRYIGETGLNAQAAARLKRYAFLGQVASKHGARKLLLGHHADDQAETVLMRVLRGTGISGLAGIPHRRTENNLELIRPLLRITKQELVAYCERNGIPFAIDSSNESRKYFRNTVRLDLIPLLERHNPRLKESLVRLAEMAAADDDYLETEARRRLEEVAIPDGAGYRIRLLPFRGLHVALQRRVIKLILSCCADLRNSLDFRHIEDVLHAMADGRQPHVQIDLGGGWTFSRTYDEAYIGPARVRRLPYNYTVSEIPWEQTLGESGRVIRFDRWKGPCTSLPANRWEAFFDESALMLPLAVRTRKPGDRMAPIGLNGTKKVQDIFVDAKIPRTEREDWPIVADAGERIVWIPGVCRSAIAAIDANTKSVVRMTVAGMTPLDGCDLRQVRHE
jgi:tRNA(Ile)-lysidine synthase